MSEHRSAEENARANHPAEQHSIYEQLGGEEFFDKLTREFYRRVQEDTEFAAMYPEEDLFPPEHLSPEERAAIDSRYADHFEASARRLKLFLIQYFGGPSTYQAERGHPRLRLRHDPYVIGVKERDIWLKHMRAAMDTMDIPMMLDDTMWDYFERAARAMQNSY